MQSGVVAQRPMVRKANIFTIAVLQNKFIDSHIKKLWGGGKAGGILVESVTIRNDIIYQNKYSLANSYSTSQTPVPF